LAADPGVAAAYLTPEGRNPVFRKNILMIVWILIAAIGWPLTTDAQSPPRPTAGSPAAASKATLIQAIVCEDVKDGIPVNAAVAFSISAGKIYCFTIFDGIAEDMPIYHHWIFRDRPSARIRLSLKPPRWATYSSIQLREADKGPWRVEITDAGGRVLKILRFSVTD
jgi:Protein of unknown function (DUF2914)